MEGRLHPDNALLPPPGIWLKRKHAYICLAVIWAYAAFWTTMPLVGLGDYAPEPFGTSCTLDWWLAQASVGGQIFILNILFFCLLLPTAVIVFSYVKIIAKVKSSSKEVAHFDSRIHSSHVLEVKLTKVTAFIFIDMFCNQLKLHRVKKLANVKTGRTSNALCLCPSELGFYLFKPL